MFIPFVLSEGTLFGVLQKESFYVARTLVDRARYVMVKSTPGGLLYILRCTYIYVNQPPPRLKETIPTRTYAPEVCGQAPTSSFSEQFENKRK